MKLVPLVETTRGMDLASASIENVHYGAVAVVDVSGRVLYHAGDPHYLTFTRSALKPLQALALVQDRGIEQLGLDSADLVLFCASHSGEPRHVGRVASILSAIGCAESDLCCGCQVPLYYSLLGIKPPADAVFSQLHHNCSGKHTGMLAWCRLHNLPLADYLSPLHPLQQRIQSLLLGVLDLKDTQIAAGIDGCSAPNYAVPLSALAHLYARIAQGDEDQKEGQAFAAIFNAMTQYPELVSGEKRLDLALMTAMPDDWISKAGADGVQAIASRQRGIGIAVKIGDGSARALNTAVIGVLGALDMLGDSARTKTAAWHEPAIKNNKGVSVGSLRSRVSLQAAQ